MVSNIEIEPSLSMNLKLLSWKVFYDDYHCSKNDAADMVRAGRLQSLGGNVQPSIGAKKIIDQDEVVMVLLRETSTETVLSLPSFITASDMREVSEAKQRPIVHFVTELTSHQYNATFKSYREVLFFTAMALG